MVALMIAFVLRVVGRSDGTRWRVAVDGEDLQYIVRCAHDLPSMT